MRGRRCGSNVRVAWRRGVRVEFHNPADGVMWSLPVSAEAITDTLVISVPGVKQAGQYTIVVFGLNENGESSDIGHYPFELQFPAGVANP